MAVLDPRRALLLATLTLPLAAGCAHGGKPQSQESSATAAASRAPTEKPPSPRVKPPERPPPQPPPPTPILVEIQPESDDAPQPPTLAEASRAARERRRLESGRQAPIAVINNENLQDFARAGELTYVEPDPAATAEAEVPADPDRRGAEEYWRGRARELRESLARAAEERQELEDRSALLRRRFYAEDDPFVRDGQIKPEWDRALERIAEVREEEERYRAEIEELYEEGVEAGAETSWLDEGEELDPEFDDDAREESGADAAGELEAHEVVDPPFGS